MNYNVIYLYSTGTTENHMRLQITEMVFSTSSLLNTEFLLLITGGGIERAISI